MAAETRRTARAGRLAAGIIGLVALGLVVGLLVNGDDGDADAEGARVTSLAAVAEAPRSYLDERVLVSAQIGEVLGPRTFVVGGARFVEGGNRMLVVADRALAIPSGPRAGRPLLEGDLVQIVGEVETFDAARFEEEIGADLSRDFSFFDGRPAIMATSVTVTPQLRAVAGDATVEAIVDDPDRFYGELVSLSAPVERVLRRDAFVLAGGLLVLTTWGEAAPADGDRVDVIGTVRRFDPDQRLPGGALADDELFGDFADSPALIASGIVAPDPE